MRCLKLTIYCNVSETLTKLKMNMYFNIIVGKKSINYVNKKEINEINNCSIKQI